jgi:sugar fermentation stimulation protein A
MKQIQLFDNFLEAEFIARPNRFVMELKLGDRVIEAYVPNTGRMTEFLFPGRKFYLTQQKMPKFNFKVIGTEYQGNYVFLDTIRVNSIMQEILNRQKIAELRGFSQLKREYKILNSKFDFKLAYHNSEDRIIEVKSCTLCHKGTAMFPDAPTLRGQRHLEDLNELAERGHESWIIFLITNFSANKFLPNYHVDFDYGKLFLRCNKVRTMALKLKFADPVTLLPEAVTEVEIDHERLKRECRNAGTYLLVLNNQSQFQRMIGALGERKFQPGYYVYIGSALRNLEQRLKRHNSKRKKIHWHIDSIIPEPMQIVKTHVIRRELRLESKLAEKLSKIGDGEVQGFGASDDQLDSHLIYFREDPRENDLFIKTILDFRTASF